MQQTPSEPAQGTLPSVTHLTTDELYELQFMVRDRIQELENIERDWFETALSEWFKLAKQLLPEYGQVHTHTRTCLTSALFKAFSNLPDQYKWREYAQVCRELRRCDARDCHCIHYPTTKKGPHRVQLWVSTFLDRILEDNMTFCLNCWELGKREQFDIDVEEYLEGFEEWLGKVN